MTVFTQLLDDYKQCLLDQDFSDATAARSAVIAEYEQAARRAQVVPQGWKLVPVELLERATESLGSFVSDHGWGQADMDTFDDLSALAAAPQQPENQTTFQTEVGAAPVQMPDPAANAEGGMIVWNRSLGIPPIEAKLYTEHQVRQLLAQHGVK